jgi:phage terminase large subunit GpA-like protein
VNVDDAKTIIFNRLKIDAPGPGYCHFPDKYEDKHFKQLTNETKKEERRAGRLVGYKWVKKGPNEQLDCRAYNLGVFERLNPNLAKIKLRLEKKAKTLVEPSRQVPEPSMRQKIRQPVKQNEGFVGSWKKW